MFCQNLVACSLFHLRAAAEKGHIIYISIILYITFRLLRALETHSIRGISSGRSDRVVRWLQYFPGDLITRQVSHRPLISVSPMQPGVEEGLPVQTARVEVDLISEDGWSVESTSYPVSTPSGVRQGSHMDDLEVYED